ncbi:MAG: hypothetical protein V4487_09035 [Chlamydiota bacterium]
MEKDASFKNQIIHAKKEERKKLIKTQFHFTKEEYQQAYKEKYHHALTNEELKGISAAGANLHAEGLSVSSDARALASRALVNMFSDNG